MHLSTQLLTTIPLCILSARFILSSTRFVHVRTCYLEYQPRLVFESGNYFIQHNWRCSNNSRVASDQVNTGRYTPYLQCKPPCVLLITRTTNQQINHSRQGIIIHTVCIGIILCLTCYAQAIQSKLVVSQACPHQYLSISCQFFESGRSACTSVIFCIHVAFVFKQT